MKLATFSLTEEERNEFEKLNGGRHELIQFECHLDEQTGVLVRDCNAVCVTPNDSLNSASIAHLGDLGIKNIFLRANDSENVDLSAAHAKGISVIRISPQSNGIAEFALSLLLGLTRKPYRANQYVKELNFSQENLIGEELGQKTVGVVGLEPSGRIFAQMMRSLGCRVLAYGSKDDQQWSDANEIQTGSLQWVLHEADFISLHLNLSPNTRLLMNELNLNLLKRTAYLINCSSTALVDIDALIRSLSDYKISGLGLDIDRRDDNGAFGLSDDQIEQLTLLPNTLVTYRQGANTIESIRSVAREIFSYLDTLSYAPDVHVEV